MELSRLPFDLGHSRQIATMTRRANPSTAASDRPLLRTSLRLLTCQRSYATRTAAVCPPAPLPQRTGVPSSVPPLPCSYSRAFGDPALVTLARYEPTGPGYPHG